MADDDLEMSSSAEFEEKPEVVQEEESEVAQEDELEVAQEDEPSDMVDDVAKGVAAVPEQAADDDIEWHDNPVYEAPPLAPQADAPKADDTQEIVAAIEQAEAQGGEAPVIVEDHSVQKPSDMVDDVAKGVAAVPEQAADDDIEWHDNPVYEAPPLAPQADAPKADDTQEIVAAIEQAEAQGGEAPVIVEDHSVHVDGNNNVVTGAGNITQSGGAGFGAAQSQSAGEGNSPLASAGAGEQARHDSPSNGGDAQGAKGKRPGEGPYFEAAYNEDGTDRVDPAAQMMMGTLDDSADMLSNAAKNLGGMAKDVTKPTKVDIEEPVIKAGPTGAA